MRGKECVRMRMRTRTRTRSSREVEEAVAKVQVTRCRDKVLEDEEKQEILVH